MSTGSTIGQRVHSLFGLVVGTAMNKTVKVRVAKSRMHPLVLKACVLAVRARAVPAYAGSSFLPPFLLQPVVKHTNYLAHDEKEACVVGDWVRIESCRKLSKLKRYTLGEIVRPAARYVDEYGVLHSQAAALPPSPPSLSRPPRQALMVAAPHARFGWAVPAVGVVAFAVGDFSSASRRLALVAAAAVSFLGFRWLLGACTRAAICYTASNSGKPGFERRWAIHHLAAAVIAVLSGKRVPVCLPPLAAMPTVSRLHLSELFPDLQRAADEVATALRAITCEQPCSAIGAAILAAAAAYGSAIASYTARVATRAAARAGRMLIPLRPPSTAEPPTTTATAMKLSNAVDTTPTVATNEIEDEPVVTAARMLLTGPPPAVAPAVTVPHLRALVAQLDDAWLGALAVDTAAAYRQLAEELQEQQKSELQQRKKMAKTGEPTPPVSSPAADDAVLQRLAELVVMAREGGLPRGVALDMARGLAPRIGATIKGMAADLLGECAASDSYAVPASVADRIVRSRATALVIEAPKDAGPGVSLVLASALMLGGGALVALDV
ncbi:hypothetical protein HK405_013843, partial [Cladochytrium tenue]